MRWKSWSGVALIGGLCAAVGVVLIAAYTASQQAPDFYSQALAMDAQVKQQAAQEMSSRVTMLYNEVRRAGSWDALFTDDQINGWLAVDLEENFADMLAENVHAPRVRVGDKTLTLAARVDGDAFSTIFTLTIEPYLHEPNVVAFRIRKARAGLLPLPMNDVLREVTIAVENLGLPLSWTQVEGDPVALITLIPQRDEDENVRWLDHLEVHDGEIYVAGRTTPAADLADAPVCNMPEAFLSREPEEEKSR